MQEIIVFILFAAAAAYLAYQTLYRPFLQKNKAGCAKGCGSCEVARQPSDGPGFPSQQIS